MLKGFTYFDSSITRGFRYVPTKGRDMGYVYVVKLNFGNYSLLKIGATGSIQSRLANFPKSDRTIVAVSKPHLNYFENESRLHKFFENFRLPAKGNVSRIMQTGPELFHMDMVYFFKELPELFFETDLNKVDLIELPNNYKLYTSKKYKFR